jgi:hypothetical protein
MSLLGTVNLNTKQTEFFLYCHVAGIQQAPAVGRGIMEMVMDGGFETIDFTRMSFDRLIMDVPLIEQNIV